MSLKYGKPYAVALFQFVGSNILSLRFVNLKGLDLAIMI